MTDLGIFEAGTHPAGSDSREDIAAGLDEAGARRALAEQLRADAMHDIAAWARAALEQDMPVAEIARRAGVTRQTVYDITA